MDKKNNNTTCDHFTTDMDEMYDECADQELFSTAYNIIDYCRCEAPVLLNRRDSLWTILNLLKEYITVPNTIELRDDNNSDDELFDDSLLYEK
jgi:hypothetical protein